MSRFYGDIDGRTKQGYSNGFSGHVRGWHVGGRVTMRADGDTDRAEIFATGGSLPKHWDISLGTVSESPNGLTFIPSRALRDAILASEGRKPAKDIPSTVRLAGN